EAVGGDSVDLRPRLLGDVVSRNDLHVLGRARPRRTVRRREMGDRGAVRPRVRAGAGRRVRLDGRDLRSRRGDGEPAAAVLDAADPRTTRPQGARHHGLHVPRRAHRVPDCDAAPDAAATVAGWSLVVDRWWPVWRRVQWESDQTPSRLTT